VSDDTKMCPFTLNRWLICAINQINAQMFIYMHMHHANKQFGVSKGDTISNHNIQLLWKPISLCETLINSKTNGLGTAPAVCNDLIWDVFKG